MGRQKLNLIKLGKQYIRLETQSLQFVVHSQLIITSIDLHAIEFIAGAIALVEFWSLLESLCELHPKWKVWSVLKKVIKAKGEKYLDVKLDEELPDDHSTIKGS